MKIPLLHALLALLVPTTMLFADTFGGGANTFDIKFVTIGNPSNLPDMTSWPDPVGSVPYTYRIGKYEVSRDMVEKANAIGGLDITFASNIPVYGPNNPAQGISWNEAARFVNWLNISQGFQAAYKFAVQPGEANYNANANIQLWGAADSGFDPKNLFRNKLAKYFLPSVDEWYKAAYYDPNAGVYYNFATGSDSPPIPVASGTAAGTVVYGQSQFGPADIDSAGGLSPYGTMAQNGNAMELIESEYFTTNHNPSDWRYVRGGAWLLFGANNLESPALHTSDIPTSEWLGNGFRVASVEIVPEPSTISLLWSSLAVIVIRRR